ncbi:DUF1329 domain-containing protein [Motiliproteus coralliicola]|nr:DUF1329 domain-containing protein [Motiliproteus coralliicola]
MNKKTMLSLALSVVMTGSGSVLAAVSAEEAGRLQTQLTPMGAERAGNADGTIPSWDGGITDALPGWPNANNDRPNPHADDEVLFTITAANMADYADKLTEGTKALLQAYPETFKMNVYPSRRTAAFPEAVYRETANNALTAQLSNEGRTLTGAWAGIPFPIPQNGLEVIWNHLARYQGMSYKAEINENQVFNSGDRQDWFSSIQAVNPYYDLSVSEADRADGILQKGVVTVHKPSRDSGEGYLVLDHTDLARNPRKAWTYDPGERRVRRAPNLAFDTPDRALNVYDDLFLYLGSPERYDWKLIGKKEIYIPYNNNRLNSPNNRLEDVTHNDYINAELIRYELHRVWVVEATVKEGQRHLYQKRVKYLDEDTWNVIASDRYDGNGNLWRVGFNYPVVASEIPLTGVGFFASADLKKNGYYVMNLVAGGKGFEFNGKAPGDAYFSPAGLRRRGR